MERQEDRQEGKGKRVRRENERDCAGKTSFRRRIRQMR